MVPIRIVPITVAAAATLSACSEPNPAPPPSPPAKASVPQSQQAMHDRMERALSFERTMPQAMLGKWRQTDGAVPTAAQCDGTATGNMGKVMQVHDEGYSIFEHGGRIEVAKERHASVIKAVFDTTYADTPTSEVLTFHVDPVTETLIVFRGDDGEESSRTYKRCP